MRKKYLRFLGLTVIVLGVAGAFILVPQKALAANPTTVNFQGKVVNSDGTNVADGTYSFKFRIYNTSSPTPTTACSGDSACLFEETQGSVSVTSGVFQVELGSTCSGGLVAANACTKSAAGGLNFSSNSALYLTMQFNGDVSGSHGGFMWPVIHFTSVPYAYYADSAGSLSGLTAGNFVQLAQGLQTDSSNSEASIAINKTGGTADILDLQKSGSNVMTVDNNGLVTLQPAVSLVAGQSHLTQSFTNESTTSGAIVGFNQTITVNNSTAATTTQGIKIALSDATNLSNNDYGLFVDTSGVVNPSANLAAGYFSGGSLVQSSGVARPVTGYDSSNGASAAGDTSVYVAGRYAYVGATGSATNQLNVYDISNPASPTLVGGTSTLTVPTNSISDIVVQGKFAYTAQGGGSGPSMAIYDISNPTNITKVGDDIASPNQFTSVVVTGRYAFVGRGIDNTTANTPDKYELIIDDIADPTFPNFAAGLDMGAGINKMILVGKYLYIALNGSGGNELRIYDVSNPLSPTLVGGTDSVNAGNGSDSFQSMSIYGKYLYVVKTVNAGVCSSATKDGCELQIYDISNPTTPSYVDGMDGGSNFFTAIYVNGKYAYVGSQGDTSVCSNAVHTGCELQIYDISDPLSISYASGTDLGHIQSSNGVNGIAAFGQYIYSASTSSVSSCISFSGCEFQVLNVGGVQSTSLTTGTISTGELQVTGPASFTSQIGVDQSLFVGQDAQISGSLGVGGLVNIQPVSDLVGGQNGISQSLTNASTTGGTVDGLHTTILVNNSLATSTTNGIELGISDFSSLANTNNALKISISDLGSGNKTNKGIESIVGGNNSSSLNYGGYFKISGGVSSSAAIYGSNGTSTGNVVQLQDNSTDVLVIKDGGDVVLGTSSTGSNISFAGSGNISNTIRKRMAVRGTISANDVVVIDTAANGQVTTTTTVSDPKVFGIATTTTSPQDIVISGVYQVNLLSINQAITQGDFLVTTATAGKVDKSSSPSAGAVLGRALESKAANVGGTIWVYITPGIGGSGSGNSTLSSSYNGSATTGNTIALTQNGGGVSIQDASTTVGTIFSVQKNAGGVTYLGVTATGINIQSNATGSAVSALSFDTSTTTPHLKIFGSDGVKYADIYYDNATSTAVFGASSGTAVLGSGTGSVTIAAGASSAVTITGNAASTISTTAGNLTLQGGSGTVSLGTTTILTAGGGFQVQSAAATALTLTSNAQATWSTTAGNLTIQAGAALVLDAASGSTITIGNTASGNYVQFAATTRELFLFGSARHNRSMVISPEYPGATLSRDGSSATNGSMVSDNSFSGGAWRNYYEWTSSQATNQDYTIIVRVTLPSDFDGWQTGTCPGSTCALEVAYQTGLAATTNNGVSVLVNNSTDTPGTAVCTISEAASTSWASFGCTSSVLDDNVSPEWDAAGETAVIRIKLKANSTASALARAGDINLRYLSKW